MELRLRYPPTPAHAPDHAEIAVEAARDADGAVLDYEPTTLVYVDARLESFHAEGRTAEEVGEAVFALGCYLGEVLCRNLGGFWTTVGESAIPSDPDGDDRDALVVEFGDGFVERPVARCFRVLRDGPAAGSALDLYRIAEASGSG